MNKDPRSLVVEFPAVFMRLKELCALTANECQMKSLKIAIYFGQDIVKQLRQAGVMSAQYSSLPKGKWKQDTKLKKKPLVNFWLLATKMRKMVTNLKATSVCTC